MRRTQGCLTDCIAYFFNIHPEKVPYFVYPRKDWMKRVRKFFKSHGYKCHWQLIEFAPLKKSGLQIVCGNSLAYKNASHAVVYRGRKLAYDPQYPSKWSEKRITHRLIISRIK